MSNYITSDLHLQHKRIIEFCPESRGHFASTEEMTEGIINNINSVVTDNDRLYILGDIAFCPPGQAVDYLKRINGEKVIIWGNHDRKLRGSTEFEYQKSLMGVIDNRDYLATHFKVDDKNCNVVMMHFPIYSWDGVRFGGFHFFGHLHSKQFKWVRGRSCDIGLDSNNMMPHKIDDLIRSRIKDETSDPGCIQQEDYHG